MFFKKTAIALISVISLTFQSFNVFAEDVIIGGESIGIKLNYDGILITGTYDIEINNKSYNPRSDGYLAGDIIKKINNYPVTSIHDLSVHLKSEIENKHNINLIIERNHQTLSKCLKVQCKKNTFSTGLYVQDGLQGIGTMTYYNPNTHNFAALGHIMSDSYCNKNTNLKNGVVYESSVKKIIPSENGNPGEKIADINDIRIGSIYDNNQYGIYGSYKKSLQNHGQHISTANIDEVKKGEAYFLTVLDGKIITKCPIVITHLKKQDTPSVKGITFEIKDKRFLSLTNGIIQGMSGSPIIQNDKLIGCVTHVDIHNVHKGYGLYIDWMLKNDY